MFILGDSQFNLASQVIVGLADTYQELAQDSSQDTGFGALHHHMVMKFLLDSSYH